MAEIELPVLRNDGTVAENLTENAINNILPARYTSEGEAATEVFERVAKNVALAELAFLDDRPTFQPKHVKPDHPRRDELLEDLYGTADVEEDAEMYVTVNEDNVKNFSYDAILDDLNDDQRDVLVKQKNEFQSLMEKLGFTPNSPTLMNAGDELQQLSACFVISPEDDIDEIHDTAREAASVFQSGGGMGYGFWKLRPKGESVGSTGGVASGPITFMRTYDQMCETIAQGGARRGAQMGVMKVDHPDIIEFIHAKRRDVSLAETLRLNDPDDFTHSTFSEALEEAREIIDEEGRVPEYLRNAVEGHLSNFNISVGATDEFMQAVENDTLFVMRDPQTGEPFEANVDTKEMYELFGLGEYVEIGQTLKIPARELWDHILEGAHENGEPGVVFIDRFNKEHSFPVDVPRDYYEGDNEYVMNATNPCGEQPLMEYEACNLGHINLSTIVDEDAVPFVEFDGTVEEFFRESLDMEEFNYRIEVGTRFLDNVVTMSDFPVDKIEQTVANNRKIGLGVMGLAQLFIQLGVEYGSDEGNELAGELMRHINHESKRVSNLLANERGKFANWDDSKYADPTSYPEWFEKQTGEDAEMWANGFPVRNHNTTTIAPTGTTSMIANTSGGCEPIYSVGNFKNVSDDVQGDEMLVQFDSLFLEVLNQNGISREEVKEEIVSKMEANEFSGVDCLETVPQEIGDLFVTTSDLSALEHAGVQCAMQEGVDSAISKTVNAPNDATLDDTRQAFEFVYKNGGKGVTYYRDGTRSKQVLTTRADNQATDEEDPEDTVNEYLQDEYGVGLDVVEDVIETGSASSQSGSNDSQGHTPRERPNTLQGKTYRVETGYGSMYVTVNDLDGKPFEVIATIGKSGGMMESMIEGIARMVSSSLRAGMNVESVIDQLQGIRSPRVGWDDGEQIQSVPDGIASVLKRHIEKETVDVNQSAMPKNVIKEDTEDELKEMADGGDEFAGICPSCTGDGEVVMTEGCKTCQKCGWSEC